MQVIASMFTGKNEPEVFGKAWAELSKEFWTSRLKGYGWIGEKVSQVIENREKVYASCYRRRDETPVYSQGGYVWRRRFRSRMSFIQPWS
jgi:hypothetical protein